jgi:hypothetical protein
MGFIGPQGPAGASPFTLSGNNVFYNDGFVGIGTSSPNSKLHIQGDGIANTTAGIIAETTGGTFGPSISLRNGAPEGHAYSLVSAGSGNDTGSGFFEIFDITAQQSRFVIHPSGNVGIGTLNPGFALDVNGTVNAGAFKGDGSQLTGITTSNANALQGHQASEFAQVAQNNNFTGTNTFNGVFVNGLLSATTLSGNGAAITNLNAAALTGALSDSSFGSNVPRLNATKNAFSGQMQVASLQVGTDVPQSSGPRMMWTTFLPEELNLAYVANSMIPDQAITVTRITLRARHAAKGKCNSNLVVRLGDAAGVHQDVVLNPGTTGRASFADSGAINLNFGAGDEVDLSIVTPASSCEDEPADANVTVEYRMQ